MNNKLRIMILTALTAAICVVGSFIKVPGFITTAALDSAPAFLSVVFLPPIFSGIAGGIGHVATALTSGFPFGPLHLLIAGEMFLIVYAFNLLHRKGFHIFKWVFLIIANGIISPLPFYFIISSEFYFGALPSLIIASVINAIVAMAIIPILGKVWSQHEVTN